MKKSKYLNNRSKFQRLFWIKSIIRVYEEKEQIKELYNDSTLRREILLLLQFYITSTNEKVAQSNNHTPHSFIYEKRLFTLIYLQNRLIYLVQLPNLATYDKFSEPYRAKKIQTKLSPEKTKKNNLGLDLLTIKSFLNELSNNILPSQKLFYMSDTTEKALIHKKFNPYLEKINSFYKDLKKFLLE